MTLRKWIANFSIWNPPNQRNQAEPSERVADARAIERLTKALEDDDWTVQIHAVEKLRKLGLPAVNSLIKALKNKSRIVRWEAVEALGQIGDPCAIEPLIQAFESEEKDSGIQLSIVEALGAIHDTRVVEFVIQLLQHENPTLRMKAVKMLMQKGDTQAVKGLIQTLKDQEPDIRLQAATALDNVGWKTENLMEKTLYLLTKKEWGTFFSLGSLAVESLTKIVEDQNSFLREEAEVALKIIYPLIESVIFGNAEFRNFKQRTTLRNPDVSTLTIAMPVLKRIHIHTETYSFHQVERFITYAVNYVGQKHLREQVDVYIYGDPDKLHPNLRNGLENLCKCVNMHEKIQE